VFERFSEGARQVVVNAREAADQLNHHYIGTEHLLLGLLWNGDEMSAQVLMSFGVTLDDVIAKVVEIVGRGEDPQAGQVPFTPRAKKTLELSLREALALGHNIIDSGHLLLALLREGEGVAMRILLDAGLEPGAVRTRLVELLGQADLEAARSVPSVSPRVMSEAGFAFSVGPDAQLKRLLMTAGGRALAKGRLEFTVNDLIAVLQESPETRKELGGDSE
jgi:ATP-dependent Clp protease ATP-binding subunit ClpC